MFSLVGLSGVGIHMAILSLVLLTSSGFAIAQSIAAIGAMTWNFILNNLFTYRDERLSGWRFLTGLIRFQLICSIGAVANVGLAIFIYSSTNIWWLAGLGGVLIRGGLELRRHIRVRVASGSALVRDVKRRWARGAEVRPPPQRLHLP